MTNDSEAMRQTEIVEFIYLQASKDAGTRLAGFPSLHTGRNMTLPIGIDSWDREPPIGLFPRLPHRGIDPKIPFLFLDQKKTSISFSVPKKRG